MYTAKNFRLRSILFATLLIVNVLLYSDSAAGQQATGFSDQRTGNIRRLQLPDPVVTPRKKFDIPFDIDDPVGRLIEVQLYVSTDQGKNWTLYARTNPQKKIFPFQSVGDGQYLFALKTLDRDRRLLPIGPPIPTLNIVVDTTRPTLALQVDPGVGGRVVTSFRAADPNLVRKTFRLSYRLDGVGLPGNWVPINFPNKDLPLVKAKGRKPKPGDAEVLSDRIGWWPQPGAKTIVVKAEIKDQAGNMETTYQPINLAALTQIRTQTPPSTISTHLTPPTQKTGRVEYSPYSPNQESQPNRIKASLASSKQSTEQKRPGPDSPIQPVPAGKKSSHPNAVSNGSQPRQSIKWAPTHEIGSGKEIRQQNSSNSVPQGRSIPNIQQKNFHLFSGTNESKPNPQPLIKEDESFHPAQPKTQFASQKRTRPNRNLNSSSSSYDHLGTMGSVDGQLTVSESSSPLLPRNKNATSNHQKNLAESSSSQRPKQPVGSQTGSNKSSDSKFPSRTTNKTPFQNAAHTVKKSSNERNIQPFKNPLIKPNPQRTESQPKDPNGSKNQSSFQRFTVPENVRPFLVNHRSFRLRYAVDGLETVDIAAVTVFGSADGGKTWAKIQNDPDKKSPVQILVNRPGIYGFRVVITSRTGVSSPIPKPGDKPDVYVQIDLTAPTPKITAARYSQPGESSHLKIQYSAIEPDLAQRPITVAYSTGMSGPWTTVASNLPNTGKYRWMIGANMPGQVYLRISATDKAGNVGYHQLPDPINIAPLIPKGKILGLDR